MKSRNPLLLLALLALVAAPAFGQTQGKQTNEGTLLALTDTSKVTQPAESAAVNTQPAVTIQHLRPQDQRGINVFEPPKDDNVPYTGFKLDWGAAFTQQFQSLDHSNAAAPRMITDATGNSINANQLIAIGSGFNNAVANLYLNAQLAPGIRVALTTYLSSRHHNETWVKDGYLLIDDSPIRWAPLESLMDYVTVRAGHFEVNYGDAHFRRSDNGNALYNPFVGNYILDAFTTEIGGEVYVRVNGFLAMAGVTGGEIRGNLATPDDRAPAFLGKLGFDRQLTPDLRVRLTGSAYTVSKSPASTLYAGDRAGSRYYYVLENVQSTTAANFTSGLINPGFRREVTAFQLNPFIKLGGLEFFGVAEQAKGRLATETEERAWNQYAGDLVYRFLSREQLFVGGRYNVATGELAGMAEDVSIDRVEIGAGWFITPSILMKGEYVTQKYSDFPITDIRHGGKFNGFMVEGVVAF